jgi:hypothetical protein
VDEEFEVGCRVPRQSFVLWMQGAKTRTRNHDKKVVAIAHVTLDSIMPSLGCNSASAFVGSQRSPEAMRNQPLKSIAHSSLGAVAGATISPCAIGRRDRRFVSTSPARFRMSPIVEGAGQASPGCFIWSHTLIFFAPKRGNLRRVATTASISRSCGRQQVNAERGELELDRRSGPERGVALVTHQCLVLLWRSRIFSATSRTTSITTLTPSSKHRSSNQHGHERDRRNGG